jgi:hypothetical protein
LTRTQHVPLVERLETISVERSANLVAVRSIDASVRHAPQSWKPSATLIELLIGLDRMPVS